MKRFSVKTEKNTVIRFDTYIKDAPRTVDAFLASLPFTRTFYHARVSGQEIWIDDAPQLHVIQENATVFALPGEVAIGPMGVARNKVSGFMGVFYGEGRLVDCSNIFARVMDEDLQLLKDLGDDIWRHGAQQLTFDVM